MAPWTLTLLIKKEFHLVLLGQQPMLQGIFEGPGFFGPILGGFGGGGGGRASASSKALAAQQGEAVHLDVGQVASGGPGALLEEGQVPAGRIQLTPWRGQTSGATPTWNRFFFWKHGVFASFSGNYGLIAAGPREFLI